jgi:hypothetical protein
MWNESRRNEGGATFGELAVIDAAASHQLILNRPGEAGFGVFLNVARHVRVAASADGYIERRAGASRVCQGRAETHGFDESFGLKRVLHALLRLAPPHAVTIGFDLFRQLFHQILEFNSKGVTSCKRAFRLLRFALKSSVDGQLSVQANLNDRSAYLTDEVILIFRRRRFDG